MREFDKIKGISERANTLSLATIDLDGSPRATPLYFAMNQKLQFLFLSSKTSQHTMNLSRVAACSICVYPEASNWKNIQGLQMKGIAEVVPSEDLRKGMQVYGEKFPIISMLHEIVSSSILFRFCPTWIRIIDNRIGFSHHIELDYPFDEF